MKKTTSFVLCIMMTISLLSVSAFAQSGLSNFQKTLTYKSGQFGDVASSDWFSPNVGAAYEYGLMLGNTDGSFGSNSNVKISEVVAMAARLSSIYTTGSASFTASTPWYQTYVDYAVEKGIISAGRFENYDVYSTRFQVAEILVASLPDTALPTINTIEVGQIPDVSLETPYISVYTLYRAGVVTGKTAAGNFNPSDKILRSEMAAIVTRMADASLRVKFTIQAATTGVTVSEITTKAELLAAVKKGQEYASFASGCYSDAYQYAINGSITGTRGGLTKTKENVQAAAEYAKAAAAYCKANSAYSSAYDDLNNTYLACTEAAKNIDTLYAAPFANPWSATKTLMTDSLTKMATAITTIQAITG